MTSWYRAAQVLEDMEGEPYSETCYHGSVFDRKDGAFEEVEPGWNTHECVWVTPDEQAAEWFSLKFRGGAEGGPDLIPVVFEVPVELRHALRISDMNMAMEVMDIYGCSDLSECIPFLQTGGFDGWITVGGAAPGQLYEDVAVFYETLSPSRAKTFTKDGWGEYMDMEQLMETFKSNEE